MANKTIRGAVIGYGGMGHFHARQMRKIDGIELAGVYDIDPAVQQKAAQDGDTVYESREALLSDPQIDLVVVATPNDAHCELVCAALNAGKNVICEKPVAMSMAELDRMIETAKRCGTASMWCPKSRSRCVRQISKR